MLYSVFFSFLDLFVHVKSAFRIEKKVLRVQMNFKEES